MLQQHKPGEDGAEGGSFPSDVSTLTYLPCPEKVEFCFCLLPTKRRSLPRGPPSVLQVLFVKCSPYVPLERKFLVTFPWLHKRLCTAKCQAVLHPRNIFHGLCLCWCLLLQPRDAQGWESPLTALKTCQSRSHQDQPQPFQLLRRFWAAWDSLVMILQEIKGKWSSRARRRPLQTQPVPGRVYKVPGEGDWW